MRAMLGCTVVVLTLGFSLSADDKKEGKIDTAKLVGKWEDKNTGKGEKVILELTKDNKIHLTRNLDKKDMTFNGTYKIEGNKITMDLDVGGKSYVTVSTIDKLTDEELVIDGDMQSSKSFKRVKDK